MLLLMCDMNPGWVMYYSVKKSLRFLCFAAWKEMHDTGVRQYYVNYQVRDIIERTGDILVSKIMLHAKTQRAYIF